MGSGSRMCGMSKFLLPALISIGSLISLPPASASTAPGDAPSQGLEEIIVTAQKRSEDLQKVSLAVSAITGDALKNAGVFDPQGLTDLVPGLEVGYNNSNTTFAIRGISSTTDATLGDAAVAFHLDGVFQGRPAAASGLFYDVARVEVLRGPQGTLYGRNATAGTINVITNHPNFDGDSGSAEVEAGNYGLLRSSAMFNAPLSETLAVRGAMETLRHNGYLSDGYNDADDIAARLQAFWRPTDSVSLLMYGDFFHQGGVGPGLTMLSRVTPCDFNPASPTYTTCTTKTNARFRTSCGCLRPRARVPSGSWVPSITTKSSPISRSSTIMWPAASARFPVPDLRPEALVLLRRILPTPVAIRAVPRRDKGSAWYFLIRPFPTRPMRCSAS